MKRAMILLALAVPGAFVASGVASGRGASEPVITPEPLISVAVPMALVPVPPVMAPALAGKLVAAHNRERQNLGMPPLQWNEGLAQAAKYWAVELARSGRFEHSPQSWRGPQGENLFMGTAGAYRAPRTMAILG